jgi:cell division protein FtsQ
MNRPGPGPGRGPFPDPGDGGPAVTRPRPGDGADETGPGAPPPGRPAPDRGRSPWRTAFFGVAAAALVAGIAWALLGSKLLVVRSVVVNGTDVVPVSQVLAAAAIPVGVPMIRVDTGAAASRVEAITQVQSAQVTKSWPDRIVITVRERTPVLAVAVPASASGPGSAGGFSLIDASGIVVRSVRVKPAGMPVYGTPIPPGTLRGSPSVAAAVAVLHEVPAPIARSVAAVTASSPENVTLELSNGVTIVWGSTARASAKATELSALMRTHAHYYDISAFGTAVTR